MTTESPETGSQNRVQAVQKTFKIIRKLHEIDSCGVSELATELDIPKSTIDVHLQTLYDLGYLVRTEDGKYRLGLRFLEHGGKVRKHRDIYRAARPEVDELSQETGEVATIGYEENGKRVLLYRTEPTEGVSDNAPTGQFTNMHWTALGKALLSQKTDETIEAIVERDGLPKATDNTITDLEALLEEVQQIRERGYSVEDEERIEGVRSVAVPVQDLNSQSGVAAISVAGPKRRFGDDRIVDELVDTLRNTENVIELKYKHY